MPKQRIALTLAGAGGAGPWELVAAAEQAQALGYDDVWFSDTGYPDPLTLAATVATHVRRLRIGVAVVPVYTRTPAVLASTAATLHELSQGRFLLGLGTSSHRIIEDWHGLVLDRPLARVRQTVELLRAMLAGQRTDYQGQSLRSRGFRMRGGPWPVPLYIAALRPRMLRLAAAVGDGVVLNLFPRDALGSILGHIHDGAVEAGRDPSTVEVACRYQVAVTEQVAEHREVVRPMMAAYYATEVYNRYLAWAGYGKVAEAVRQAWEQGDRAAACAAISDELVDEVAWLGSADHCRARLREYARAGIHTHIITPATADPQVRRATLEAFSPEAAGALRLAGDGG